MFKKKKLEKMINRFTDEGQEDVTVMLTLPYVNNVSITVKRYEVANTLDCYFEGHIRALSVLALKFAKRVQESTNLKVESRGVRIITDSGLDSDSYLSGTISSLGLFSKIVSLKLLKVTPVSKDLLESSVSVNGLTLKADDTSNRIVLGNYPIGSIQTEPSSMDYLIETPQQLLETVVKDDYLRIIKTLTYDNIRVINANYAGEGLVKLTVGTKLNQVGVENAIIHNIRVIYINKQDLIGMMLEGKYEPLAVAYRK